VAHRDPRTGEGICRRRPRPVVLKLEWPHQHLGRWLGTALWRIARRDWSSHVRVAFRSWFASGLLFSMFTDSRIMNTCGR